MAQRDSPSGAEASAAAAQELRGQSETLKTAIIQLGALMRGGSGIESGNQAAGGTVHW